jgi:hypothetical protein
MKEGKKIMKKFLMWLIIPYIAVYKILIKKDVKQMYAILLSVLVGFMWFGVVANMLSPDDNLIDYTIETTIVPNTQEIEKTPTPIPTTQTPPIIVEFDNGNYTCGDDFDPGTYDLEALGQGNVSSSNMYDGGLNAISPYSAKNLKFSKGDVLTLRGVMGNVHVKMTKK